MVVSTDASEQQTATTNNDGETTTVVVSTDASGATTQTTNNDNEVTTVVESTDTDGNSIVETTEHDGKVKQQQLIQMEKNNSFCFN